MDNKEKPLTPIQQIEPIQQPEPKVSINDYSWDTDLFNDNIWDDRWTGGDF